MAKLRSTIPAVLSRYALKLGSIVCVAGLLAFGLGTSAATAATTTTVAPAAATAATTHLVPQATPWVIWDSKIPEESACIIEGQALVAQGVATKYKCEQVGATWTLFIVLVAACEATPASTLPISADAKAIPNAC